MIKFETRWLIATAETFLIELHMMPLLELPSGCVFESYQVPEEVQIMVMLDLWRTYSIAFENVDATGADVFGDTG